MAKCFVEPDERGPLSRTMRSPGGPKIEQHHFSLHRAQLNGIAGYSCNGEVRSHHVFFNRQHARFGHHIGIRRDFRARDQSAPDNDVGKHQLPALPLRNPNRNHIPVFSLCDVLPLRHGFNLYPTQQNKIKKRHLLCNGSADALLLNGNAPLQFFLIRFCFRRDTTETANGLSAQNIPLDVATAALRWFGKTVLKQTTKQRRAPIQCRAPLLPSGRYLNEKMN